MAFAFARSLTQHTQRIVRRSFMLQHQNFNRVRHFSCSNIHKKERSTVDDYEDVTKNDDVIVGMKKLLKLMRSHVGWKKHIGAVRYDVNVVQSQDDLEPRCLQDSVQEVFLPLSTDPLFHDDYVNLYGGIRVGTLLQDLDYLSVWCGFKYYKDPYTRPPFSLVTACVESIDFSEARTIDPKRDLKLKGFVSWVGRSSLETTILVQQQEGEGEEWKTKAESQFIMAARSIKDGKPAILNKLIPQNEVEKCYYNRGERNRESMKKKKLESLFEHAPTAEERELIHNKFLQTLDFSRASFQSRTKPENTIWMEDTRLKNLVICQKESRNIYNKIFGGFLMRAAFELAWANACVYMKCSPTITSVGDIVFRRPVEVGSLLYLSSIVVYTSNRHAQLRVVAEVWDTRTGTFDATNTFNFCFSSTDGGVIPQVVPKTYGEYILYLDGRRRMAEKLRID